METKTAKKPNEELRYQREKRGWSQAKVAFELQQLGDGSADAKMVGKWERGEKLPRPHYRERLCLLFGRTAEQLGFTTAPPSGRGPTIQILTAEQVAQLSLQDLALEKNPSHIDQLRRDITRILGIATATVVIAPPDALLEAMSGATLPEARVMFLENEMASRWVLYHTGGAARAQNGFDYLLQEVVECSRLSRGTSLYERAHILLTMSYQLHSCILRDLMQYPAAYKAHRKALLVAQELHEPELIAAALTREGITLNQQEHPVEAIGRFSRALELIKHLGYLHLEGYTLQALSEAQAKAQQSQETWESIGQAEECLAHRSTELERSLVHMNAASVTAQKGVNAVLLHDYQGAITLIDRSLKTYDPTLVRGRARLLAQKAEASLGLGIIDDCVHHAQDALMLASSVGSTKTITRVKTLYHTLLQSPQKGERATARLGEVLALV